MILPYLPRLLCISLATYFLVHLALGVVVSLVARPAVRVGERMRPHGAANCLLMLRLLPAAGAALVVAAVCVPSYLWLEPDAPTERVGFGCLAAAALGLAMWGVSIARGLRAAALSRRFVRRCGRAIVDSPVPLLAISGIVRPRLMISRAVLRALSPEELTVALCHERAHWTAHDNLKRLWILIAPGRSRTLERAWRKFAERAADDRAVAGSPRRACALAAALVRVARMASDAPPLPLASCLLDDSDQLAARVDRLLRPAPAQIPAPRPVLALSAVVVFAGSLAIAILQPAALYNVHLALERMID
jgi:hypothetical protein